VTLNRICRINGLVGFEAVEFERLKKYYVHFIERYYYYPKPLISLKRWLHTTFRVILFLLRKSYYINNGFNKIGLHYYTIKTVL
jgi:hypothetical protein